MRDQRVSGIISLLYPGVSHISLVLYVDTLDARESKISGPIPTEIGLLTSLKSMELANTQVQGTIPTEIGLLRNIRKSLLLDFCFYGLTVSAKSGSQNITTRFYCWPNRGDQSVWLLRRRPDSCGALCPRKSL